ncbi:hypothetical protein ACFW9D_05435 [Streptomyces sp. NPDC059524]|uniref:hypothetical protein n=1 Tax=Streptomyces sp. NPDC059524 TaxID=3346856 RepID=UPI0036BF3ACD
MSAPHAEQITDDGQFVNRGPVASVAVHAHMRSGPHGLYEHPLDLTLTVELMFLLAEQARRGPEQEPLVVTPQSVLEHLKSIGVRSGNGSRLVGRDAVYESFARLRAKGYIRRVFLADEKTGQRAGVAYEFYDWPAWNPDAPSLSESGASSQVGSTSGIAGSGDAGSRKPERTKPRSSQVGSTSGNAGSGNPGTSESSQVGSTSGNAGSPPHPPEGGGNTTPSPHKKGRGNRWAIACALDPEDYVPTAEEIAAADAFLQDLPHKWQMSIDNARALAPLLASRVHALGLELDTLLEIELIADDPKDPVRVPSRVMPVRIRNLKRRRPSDGLAPASGGLAEWCGECNNGNRPYMVYERTVELPDGRDVPCKKCHPKHARA